MLRFHQQQLSATSIRVKVSMKRWNKSGSWAYKQRCRKETKLQTIQIQLKESELNTQSRLLTRLLALQHTGRVYLIHPCMYCMYISLFTGEKEGCHGLTTADMTQHISARYKHEYKKISIPLSTVTLCFVLLECQFLKTLYHDIVIHDLWRWFFLCCV